MRRKKFGAQPTNVAVKTEKKKLAGVINSEKLEIEKIDKEREDKQVALTNKTQELIALDKKLDKIRLDVLKENDKLVDAQKKIANAQISLDKVTSEISGVKEIRDEMIDAKKMIDSFRMEKEDILKKKTSITEEIVDLVKAKEKLLAEIDEIKKGGDSRKSVLSGLDGDIVSKKKQLLDLDSNLEQKKKAEADEYEIRIANWKRKEEEVKANIGDINSRIGDANFTLATIDIEVKNRMSDVIKRETKLIKDIEVLKSRGEELTQREDYINTLAKTLQKHFDKLKMPIKVI